MKPSKEIYRRGWAKNSGNSRSLLVARFFDPSLWLGTSWSLQDQQTNLQNRLLNQTIAEPLVDAETGEIAPGQKLEQWWRETSSDASQRTFGRWLERDCLHSKWFNGRAEPVVLQNSKDCGAYQSRIALSLSSAMLIQMIRFVPSLSAILAEMSYFLNLAEGLGRVDDIDHLETVGSVRLVVLAKCVLDLHEDGTCPWTHVCSR